MPENMKTNKQNKQKRAKKIKGTIYESYYTGVAVLRVIYISSLW